MGFLNSDPGSSKSNTRNYSSNSAFGDVSDSNLTSLNGLVLSGKNAKSTINLLDNGAIASAFDFAGKQSSQAYDFSRDVTEDLISKTSSQISGAIQAVSESARSETENIFINLQKYAFYGAIVWGAVMIFKTVKK